jgi:hypothetical protein
MSSEFSSPGKTTAYSLIPVGRRRGRGCEYGLSVLKCAQPDQADGELREQSLPVGLIPAALEHLAKNLRLCLEETLKISQEDSKGFASEF